MFNEMEGAVYHSSVGDPTTTPAPTTQSTRIPNHMSGYIRAKLPGKNIIFGGLIDSGNLSGYDLISERLVKRLRLPAKPAKYKLGTAGQGGQMHIVGQCLPFSIRLENSQEIFEISPYVVRDMTANFNLGPVFLSTTNSDLKFKEGKVPQLVLGTGEELDLQDNNLMNLPSTDGTFQAVIGQYLAGRDLPARLPKNHIIGLKAGPAEDEMDMPGMVHAIDGDKPITQVGNRKYNVYAAQKTTIPYNHTAYVKCRHKGPTEPGKGVLFEPALRNQHLYKRKLLPLSSQLTMQDGFIFVPVMNLNLREVTIDNSQRIGSIYLEEPFYGTREQVGHICHKPEGELTQAERMERALHIAKELKLHEKKLLIDRPDLKKRTIQVLLDNFDAVSLGPGDIGKTDLVKCRLDLKPDATPYQGKPIPLNPIMEDELRKQVNEWLDADIIEPCFSQWGSAIFPVVKKVAPGQPPQFRWVINYKEVNERLTTQNYPIPQIENNLQKLGKAMVFSALDSVSAYSAVEMEDESSKDITSFTCVLGTYRYKRMPFGLSVAPSLYQNLVQRALQLLPGSWKYALSYLDDLVVYSSTLDDHM